MGFCHFDDRRRKCFLTKINVSKIVNQAQIIRFKIKIDMKLLRPLLFLLLIAAVSCEDYSSEDGISSLEYYEDSYGEEILTGDEYTDYGENPFVDVSEEPISTFSIDADGASYANMRRYLMDENTNPPVASIRTEEFINYFDLDYDQPDGSHPIALNGEISTCPWNEEHKLVRIGIKGKNIPETELPASNYVFLIDVSGSMGSEDKLDLLINGFKYMVDELSDEDRVAIVTYAGSNKLVLESTSGSEKATIKSALEQLSSGGGTAGAEGIVTAYEVAQQHLIDGGNNRIIIGTDGDFNIGISSQEDLVKLIEEKRELGIYITVLGVGRGNLNDSALEQIANNGNGTYEYLDNIEQLKKVFIYDYSKFFAVAKDVKIQVEFDPTAVSSYRLIGYENRLLNSEDFEDDEEDAGEIGANQNITALYEIVPNSTSTSATALTVDFRYKAPDSDTSVPLQLDIKDENTTFGESSDFMKFTAAVASFSMLLRDSEYKGSSSYEQTASWIESAGLTDENGFKEEFIEIIKLK